MGHKEPVIFEIGWNACINCGACVAVCPQEAGFISAFDTIAVQRPCDIACMVCEDICPVSTITHTSVSTKVQSHKSTGSMSKKQIKTLILAMFFSQGIYAQVSSEILLYPDKIPNSRSAENLEKTETNDGIRFTTEISQPTITVFPAENPDGRALIICPGGGYFGLADDHEGMQVAKALNPAGITTFVLKYRIPDERYCIDKSLAPLQDAQQAIRYVRKNAEKWQVDPHKIGILGFSAGGHLASTAATHFNFRADKTNKDTSSVRPDFVVLIYPVISFQDSITHPGSRERLLGKKPSKHDKRFFSNALQVNSKSPPAFLVHAEDDTVVPVQNSIEYYRACLKHGVPAELHLYPKGGHGFGMINPTSTDHWMEHLVSWMDQWK